MRYNIYQNTKIVNGLLVMDAADDKIKMRIQVDGKGGKKVHFLGHNDNAQT